jgi:hypothetical protein
MVIAGPYGYGKIQPLVATNPNPGTIHPLSSLVEAPESLTLEKS